MEKADRNDMYEDSELDHSKGAAASLRRIESNFGAGLEPQAQEELPPSKEGSISNYYSPDRKD